jgi:hypothetical protein
MIRLKDFRCQECGSWNAECGKYEDQKFKHFRIPHSEFHIHLPLSSENCGRQP